MSSLRITLPGTPPRSYPVRFCAGHAEIARRLAAIARGARVFVVTDRNVRRLHGPPMDAALAREGADCRIVVLPAGERSKSRRTRDALEDALIRAGAERSSVVAAFGGGVIGDLAGFVAATLLRGIRLVQIPTTLVSQADSAVGGKVGIDHPLGKNLIGAFHHPEAVLLFPGFLRTLPEAEFRQGMAEVIKYGAVLDSRLFAALRANAMAVRARRPAQLARIIARCLALKARVVEADERDAGYRRILNFGHTVGHAVELASGLRMKHGMAVSIGMAVEAGIARELGMISPVERSGLLSLLRMYSLPITLPRGIDPARVARAIPFDKKTLNGSPRFTLMDGTGSGVTGVEVSTELIRRALAR